MASSLLDVVYERVTQLPTMIMAKAAMKVMKRELMLFEGAPPVITPPIVANVNKKAHRKAANVTKEKILVHLAALFTGSKDMSISSQKVVH